MAELTPAGGRHPVADAGLSARLEAVEAKLDQLIALVEGIVSAGAALPVAELSPDDDVWRRLGLVEGERRIVTVLFADVSGFTALSEQLDPEAFQLVMRDTMGLLASCVTEHGGTLEKFIGDALCAIFGAPVAHVDEPERAARAALAMHRALAERAESRPDLPVLGVHVGINTGPVIAGAVGDGSQFGVMGDTINSAARLMGLASEGETFVSAETARRLRAGFRLEDRGLHEVKGKAQPIAVAALTGELEPDERASIRRFQPPLVGRDEELATLRRVAARVAAGEGSTVLLLGDDGVGTSRVADELAGQLAGEGFRVLEASSRVHAETPLGLIASALGPLDDSLLAGVAPVPHDFELRLGELVSAAAAAAPLLVLLDDADGADPGSIEVVRYLSRSTGDERVLWLLTGNQVPAPFEPLVGSVDVAVVRLPPLTDEAVAGLFGALFPGALTAAQRSRLAHLADGNVQYAMEIAHALVDDGVLAESDDGRWVAVGDVDACELPGSVAELVEARIDQLPTAARLVLHDASVIGQRFGRQLLARVATVPASVDAALAELAAEELVVPASDDTGGMWAFRSRLVREVAYGSVLKRRRPAAHRAVADALLALEPGRVSDNADLLAHHYEGSDDPPLAIPHLLEAVERAELAFNITGALERARRALRLRDRFPGRVDDRDAARFLQRAGVNRLLLGDRGGLDDLEEAVALLAASAAPAAVVADLEERVGWYLAADGERAAAEAHLGRATAIAEAEGLASVLAGVAVTRAFAAGATGAVAAGLEAVDAVVAAPTGDRFVDARASMVAGVLRLWAGDAAGAVEHLRAALDVARAEVFGTIADRCARWLVAALVEAGEGDEAEAVARPILARADDRGDPTVACGVRAALAEWDRRRGALEAAAGVAAEAVAIAELGSVAPDAAADARLVAAAVALDAGDVVAAAAGLDAVEALVGEDDWLAWRWTERIRLLRERIGSTVPSR